MGFLQLLWPNQQHQWTEGRRSVILRAHSTMKPMRIYLLVTWVALHRSSKNELTKALLNIQQNNPSWPYTTDKIMFKESGLCPVLSLTHFKIIPSQYIGMTLTFIVCLSSRIRDNRHQTYWCHDLDLTGHVASPVTWPFDTPAAISHRCSIVTESVSLAIFEIISPRHIGVTTLTFLVTWRHGSSYQLIRHKCQSL